jgi:ketosteroid isomerase-like protein
VWRSCSEESSPPHSRTTTPRRDTPQAMSQENVEVVRQVFEAVARRDSESVLALYGPDVEWDVSGGPVGDLVGDTVFRGHGGLRDWSRQWYSAWESIDEHCEELIDAGEHVVSVVSLRATGRASGAEVEWSRSAVWTIRQGRVVRVVGWFPTRKQALEAAGLSE